MAKIKIYGAANTSAGRCIWTMEELELNYDVVPVDLRAKEHKSPEYLRLNPNGKVPCLVDGDFTLWESIAINHYLCEKHRPTMLGHGHQEKALVHQWSLWCMTELQPSMIDLLIQSKFVPEDKRDHAHIEKLQQRIPHILQILEQHLEGKTYMVGQEFTLADLNVASVVRIAEVLQIPISDFSNLDTWLQKIKARPAYQRYIDLRKQSAH
jgi:glutathione S-transferase